MAPVIDVPPAGICNRGRPFWHVKATPLTNLFVILIGITVSTHKLVIEQYLSKPYICHKFDMELYCIQPS